MNSAALDKTISKEINHKWALLLKIESQENIKNTGVVLLGVAEKFSINNKWGCYIKRSVTHDCSFPGPSGLSVKNRVQRESLQTLLLWLLPAQDTTHDLSNVKQISNKTYPYWKNRLGCSLPPDKCKGYNRVDLHNNIRQASFSIPAVALWHHTRTSRLYDCQ